MWTRILSAVLLIGCKTDIPAPSELPPRVSRRAAFATTPPRVKRPLSSIASDRWAPTEVLLHGDANQDGEVSDDEVVVGRYERAETLHALLDHDRDSEVSVAELGEYLWSGDVGPVSVRVYEKNRPVVDPAADLDDDGAVSIDELDAWLAKAKQ